MEFIILQETLETLEGNSIWDILKYAGSVLGGGVLYKYVSAWLGHKNSEADRTRELSETLLVNLSKRVQDLEDKVDEAHKREIAVTKQLASSEEEVRNLRQEIRRLTNRVEELTETVAIYVEKYGPLEE